MDNKHSYPTPVPIHPETVTVTTFVWPPKKNPKLTVRSRSLPSWPVLILQSMIAVSVVVLVAMDPNQIISSNLPTFKPFGIDAQTIEPIVPTRPPPETPETPTPTPTTLTTETVQNPQEKSEEQPGINSWWAWFTTHPSPPTPTPTLTVGKSEPTFKALHEQSDEKKAVAVHPSSISTGTSLWLKWSVSRDYSKWEFELDLVPIIAQELHDASWVQINLILCGYHRTLWQHTPSVGAVTTRLGQLLKLQVTLDPKEVTKSTFHLVPNPFLFDTVCEGVAVATFEVILSVDNQLVRATTTIDIPSPFDL